MPVRQQDARILDAIQPPRYAQLLIEDNVAKLLLLVRPDLEQDQTADDGVINLCIVERLVPLLDRLAVDAFAAGGVVLDLDREIAADAFDEDAILDADVRESARAMPV